MGGLVLDIVVIFAVKIAILNWRRFQTRKWPRVVATILSAHSGRFAHPA